MSAAQSIGDTYDDDTSLEFYWEPASGDVEHYNMHVSVYENYGDPNSPTGPTTYTGPSTAPTQESPYALPEDVGIADGKGYSLVVNAVGPGGEGPMSEPSDIVWCKIRSPGDVGGSIPADADGNLGLVGKQVILQFSFIAILFHAESPCVGLFTPNCSRLIFKHEVCGGLCV